MESHLFLEQAVRSFLTPTHLPSSSELVEALLETERVAKRQKIRYSPQQLLGCWRLCFVTGTQKTPSQFAKVLGPGRYLPQFLKIHLTYGLVGEVSSPQIQVENQVDFGPMHLSLSGPTKFLQPKNILAFDFTRMSLKFFGLTLYPGYLPKGIQKETYFETHKISQLPFFVYFYLSPTAIAARGKQGGLALWGRLN